MRNFKLLFKLDFKGTVCVFKLDFKGTVCVILNDPLCKDGNAQHTNLIKNVEDTVVFLILKNMQINHFSRKAAN